MKTKDFIKMLQEADPSGECHLRMPGGVPEYAIIKEGYWDGPYSYIDHQGNWVYSSEDNKVDIYCTEIEDFVSDQINIHDPNNWENIKSKFVSKLTCYRKESADEKFGCIIKQAREAYDMMYEINKSFYDKALIEMVKNAEKGWTWFQNKDVDNKDAKDQRMHIFYTWKVYNENGKEEGSNPHKTESVQKSGQWEKLDNGVKKGYYQWVLKNNQ